MLLERRSINRSGLAVSIIIATSITVFGCCSTASPIDRTCKPMAHKGRGGAPIVVTMREGKWRAMAVLRVVKGEYALRGPRSSDDKEHRVIPLHLTLAPGEGVSYRIAIEGLVSPMCFKSPQDTAATLRERGLGLCLERATWYIPNTGLPCSDDCKPWYVLDEQGNITDSVRSGKDIVTLLLPSEITDLPSSVRPFWSTAPYSVSYDDFLLRPVGQGRQWEVLSVGGFRGVHEVSTQKDAHNSMPMNYGELGGVVTGRESEVRYESLSVAIKQIETGKVPLERELTHWTLPLSRSSNMFAVVREDNATDSDSAEHQ